jgi:hypothetical protein
VAFPALSIGQPEYVFRDCSRYVLESCLGGFLPHLRNSDTNVLITLGVSAAQKKKIWGKQIDCQNCSFFEQQTPRAQPSKMLKSPSGATLQKTSKMTSKNP